MVYLLGDVISDAPRSASLPLIQEDAIRRFLPLLLLLRLGSHLPASNSLYLTGSLLQVHSISKLGLLKSVESLELVGGMPSVLVQIRPK